MQQIGHTLHKVYFVEAGGYIKIGRSDQIDLKQRFVGIQGGNPHKLKLVGIMLGDNRLEHVLHHKFRSLRAEGEWFKSGRKLMDFITNFAVIEDYQINLLQKLEKYHHKII